MCNYNQLLLINCSLLIISFISVINAFNVETVNYVLHRNDPRSMFGFSVAVHQYNGASWILVGAPAAETRQQGVERGGAVYRCSVVSDDGCQELPFDQLGNRNNSQGSQVDRKSFQWFGATVSTGGVDGRIVACAPRYMWYTPSLNRRDPVGTCYVAKGDFTGYLEFSPCRTRFHGYHRQGSCQAGMSATVSNDGKRLFIGAPGSWYWQGQLYSINSSAVLPFPPPRWRDITEGGQVFTQSVSDRTDIISTPEGSAFDDDSYMGYSVAVGRFSGTSEQNVAVGMPRGSALRGKILLYKWDLVNYQNISGEQMGAYFGYAIASVNVDGDQFDDLIIGAPMYTDLVTDSNKYETGRVYVFHRRTRQGTFREPVRLDGTRSRGRFGLSLCSLGDINLDTYGDFAVGAPYDGEEGRGAVYVYHGSRDGVREKPAQIIYAESLSEYMSTFGFSVSGGIDLDNNGYPDMAVGAYDSGKAIFFRSRPILKMEALVSFPSDKIDLEEKNCTLSNRQRVPCTKFDVCMKFDGLRVDEYVYFETQIILDSKIQRDPRMFFLTNEGRSMKNETKMMAKNNQTCQTVYVYVRNSVRDKLTPLEVEVRYSMADRFPVSQERRSGRSTLYPILDQNMPPVRKASINIQKNCGLDNVCIPNLNLIVTPTVDKYLLGSKKPLDFDIEVLNYGEDSFETVYTLKIPPGTHFNKLEKIIGNVYIAQQPRPSNNNTLKVDIGNPLSPTKPVKFRVILEPSDDREIPPSYDLFMKVNSSNPEPDTKKNEKMISIGIWVETELKIQGVSKPQTVHYNTSTSSSRVLHTYSILNNGSSDVAEAEVFFLYPQETLGGEKLMSLPKIDGLEMCEIAEITDDGYLLLGSTVQAYHAKYSSGSRLSGSSRTSSASTSYTSSGRTSVSSGGTSHGGIDYNGRGSGHRTSESGHRQWGYNSSSEHVVPGGVVRTWSRNTSYVTGPDGVTHYQESSSRSGGEEEARGSGSSYSGSRTGSRTYETGGSRTEESDIHENGRTVSGSRVSESGSTIITESRSGGSGTRSQSGLNQAGGVRVGQSGGTIITESRSGGSSSHSQSGYDRSGGRTGESVGTTITESRSGQSGYDRSGIRTGESGGAVITESRSGGSSSQSQYGYDRGGARIGESGGTIITENRSGQSGYDRSGIRTGESGGTVITESRSGGSSSHSQSGYDRSGARIGTTITDSRSGGSAVDRSNEGASSGSRTGSGSGGYDHSRNSERGRDGSYTETRTGDFGAGRDSGGYSRTTYKETRIDETRSGGYDGDSERHSSTGDFRGTGHGGSGSVYSETRTQGGNYGGARYGGEDSNRDNAGSRTTYHESSRNFSTGGQSYNAGGYDNRDRTRIPISGGYYDRDGIYRYHNSSKKYFNWGNGDGNSEDSWSTEERINENIGAGSEDYNSGGGVYAQQSIIGGSEPQFGESSFGSIAQNTGGFRTVSLDIGKLKNENRNQHGSGEHSVSTQYGSSYSRHSGENDHRSREYDPDLGYARESYEKHYRTQSSTDGPSNAYSHTQSSSASRSRWETHYDSRKSGNYDVDHMKEGKVATENRGLTHYNRYKREIKKIKIDDELMRYLKCDAVKCGIVRCLAGPFVKNKTETSVTFNSEINSTTVKSIGANKPVNISTVVLARISKLKYYIGTPRDRPIESFEVFSSVVPEEVPKPDIVPLWVVVLSAIAGTIILLLIIYLLHKAGFFKRNRPHDSPEREPLKRNGHYQNGDEQL